MNVLTYTYSSNHELLHDMAGPSNVKMVLHCFTLRTSTIRSHAAIDMQAV